MKVYEVIGRTFIGLVMFVCFLLIALTVYGAVEESNRKTKFDNYCIESGGIPLRATWHYDPTTHTIHYVCLKQTAIMNLIED